MLIGFVILRVIRLSIHLDGFLPESCSYHRVHMGLPANIRDGVPVREDMQLPIPDVMFTAPLCPEMAHLADSVYRRFGVPVVSMHCPTPYREADIPGNSFHAPG